MGHQIQRINSSQEEHKPENRFIAAIAAQATKPVSQQVQAHDSETELTSTSHHSKQCRKRSSHRQKQVLQEVHTHTHAKQELLTHSKNASSRGSPKIDSNLGHATKVWHLNQESLQVKSLPEKLMAAIKLRVNFWETFAPVASQSTIWFILTKVLADTQAEIKHGKKYKKIPLGFDIQGQDAKNLYRQSQMSKELNAIIPDMKKENK
jgi:hypothetical protein